MSGLVIKLIEYMMFLFVGGYFISSAVKNFKSEQYFMFGFDVTVSIYLLTRVIFTFLYRKIISWRKKK